MKEARPATLYIAEPAADYANRPRLVVDATVVAAHLFGERDAPLARASMPARALHAPPLIDCELASVAVGKERREGWSAGAVREALGFFAELAVDRREVDAVEVVDLAQRYALSACDAAYLWLADKLDAPLATFSAKLAEAAQRHLADRAPDA